MPGILIILSMPEDHIIENKEFLAYHFKHGLAGGKQVIKLFILNQFFYGE